MKIYTKTGDHGRTGLQGGRRVPKSDPRIMAYGALDEANAILGMALLEVGSGHMRDILVRLQNEIFVLGADLSNITKGGLRVDDAMTAGLERDIDDTELHLEPLANFILPGGGPAGSMLHLARTVVRRAETHIAAMPASEPLNEECRRYINRLSDLLFVLAREANRHDKHQESVWRRASGNL